jgi:hypothetical protein
MRVCSQLAVRCTYRYGESISKAKMDTVTYRLPTHPGNNGSRGSTFSNSDPSMSSLNILESFGTRERGLEQFQVIFNMDGWVR